MLTSKMKVKPIGKNLLVRPLESVKKIGAIFVPDQAKNKPLVGRVVAMGEGLAESKYVGKWPPEELGIKKGTLILFDRFAGVELPVDDLLEQEWPRLIHIDEVKGVIDE